MSQKQPQLMSGDQIEVLFDRNKYAEAEQAVRLHLASEPESALLHFQLGRALFGLERLQESQQALFQALAFEPDEPYCYFFLSLVCHRLKQFDSELKHAKQAAQIDPENPVFIKRLAQSHLQSGELKKAKQAAEQLITLEHDDGETFELLGEVHLELGQYADAEKNFRNALTFEPEDISLLNDLARSLMGQRKKLRESIDVLFNIIQLDPTNTTIADNLFLAVQNWLDRQKLKGKGSQAFNELPVPIQMFYQDYQKRSSVFVSLGQVAWGAVWVVGLGLLVFMFSLIT